MTLQDIERGIYRRTGYSDNPPQDVQNRVRSYINEWHRRILSIPGLTKLRDSTGRVHFDSEIGQNHYALGPSVAIVRTVSDRTNDLKLLPQSLDWHRLQEPDPMSSMGVPDYYIPVGFRPVSKQPQTTGLLVESTATDSLIVYVESVREGGYPWAGTANLVDGAVTQLGTDQDHIQVEKFYLSAPPVGVVTLRSDADGSELGRIMPGTTYTRHYTLILYPTPSGVFTYHVDYTRQILDMVNPTDEPLLPQDFHYLLVLAGRADEYERKDDVRAEMAKGELSAGVATLRHYVENPPGYFVVPGEDVSGGRSNLGAWFPSGRW